MVESIHTCPNCNAVFNPFESKLPPLDPSGVSRHVLDANDPPLESDIPLLKDFISRGRPRMTALDAEIALLQSSLDKLREERDGLESEVLKHEGVLSPLRRVPTEILSIIFAFTLPPHTPNAEVAPWTISAVCARWRSTVISQPYFWTVIRYSAEKSPNRDRAASRLETQLHRSRELPLNVEFFTSDPSDCTFNDLDMMRILCKHAGRWEKLSVSGSKRLYIELENYMSEQLSLLRELTIEMEYEGIGAMDMFSNAPLLQRVVVNKSLRFSPLSLVLPWSQLFYYGGSNTRNGHLRALHTATNLVDCSLGLWDIHDFSMPQSPIVLPHLLRLSLSHTDFLECLETPALLELYCDYADPVLPFLRRQSSNLQKLVLWECPMAADDASLSLMIETVPAVETVVLNFPLLVEFVHDFSSRPNMAPALENFACILASDLSTQEDVQMRFVQGIESRCARGRLKSVKVHCPPLAPSVLDRLEILHAQGMEFMVHPDSYGLLQDAIPPELQI